MWEIPLLNTILLLSSGATVTVAHHSMIHGNRKSAILGLIATIILASIFTGFQVFEYIHAPFTIADSVFGSVFFFGTGLNLAPIITTNMLKISQNLKFHHETESNPKNSQKLVSLDISENKFKENIDPYWVTGFSDRESSFSVKISKNELRWKFVPEFFIELHEKDIHLLYYIKNFFNTGSITVRIRKGRPTAIYSVQSLNSLNNIIIPHFKKYPLITQKRADFELFCKIVLLMNNKEHLTDQGIKKIISIKASINKGLSGKLSSLFPNIVPDKRPIINEDIKDKNWLVGFVDAEGCFYVKILHNNNISLSFSISQHSRDINLLEKIKNFFNCGVIEQVKTRPNQSTFVVYKFEDNLNKIINFFLNNKLKSSKILNFNKFSKIAELKQNNLHKTKEGFLLIKKLKLEMNKSN